MNIVEDIDFRKKLIKKINDREFSERVGIHQSDLCYCLNKQALRKKLEYQSTEQELLLYSTGWATQRWLTGQDKDVPEKIIDGITVTLDANALDVLEPEAVTRYLVPFELKCTYQSSERPIEENTHWVHQIMAQCYVTGITTAYLTRFELMGNWKSIFGKKEEKRLPENARPTLHAYRLEFTKEELERNWQWLKDRRVLLLQVIETGKLLPKAIAIPNGQDYECEMCPFRGKECDKCT